MPAFLRRFLTACLIGINLACVLCIIFSLWPGLLVDVIVLAFVLLLYPAIAIGIVLAIIAAVYFRQRIHTLQNRNDARAQPIKRHPWFGRLALATVAVFMVSYSLIHLEIPRRIAFNLSKPAFEAVLAEAPVTLSFEGKSLDKRLGIYQIPSYAADGQGGVYFKTGDHGFIWTDVYGFAYQPNQGRNPYGQGGIYHPVTKDWSWFVVTQAFF